MIHEDRCCFCFEGFDRLGYIELKKQGVKFYKTPDAILRAQLEAWDKTIAKKATDNPIFKKVLDSPEGFRPARRPVAERLPGRLQDGLQPLLRQGRQEVLIGLH